MISQQAATQDSDKYTYVHSAMSGHTPRSDVDQISDECRLSARWLLTRCESAGRLLPSTSSISPRLPLFRKRSPDVTTAANSRRPYKCRLLLIYRPQRDERLSWPSWLACSGWVTHISGQPLAIGRAWAKEVYRP